MTKMKSADETRRPDHESSNGLHGRLGLTRDVQRGEIPD